MIAERTVPVRIPADLAASLKRMAALNGTTPSAEMTKAWRWWWGREGDRIVDQIVAQAEALRPPRGETP